MTSSETLAPLGDDLFARAGLEQQLQIGPQAWLLRGLALAHEAELLADLAAVLQQAPLRHMVTRGGRRMSVQTSSCGAWGWTSSPNGYAYSAVDPQSGLPWPAMPDGMRQLGTTAAQAAGFAGFAPDSCLINQYLPESKMGLHQDRDETDFTQPIVSVSLGMSALFMWGGLARSDKVQTVQLHHGDVVVWGGQDRLRFHGVRRLLGAPHPQLGPRRINLTLRRARG